MNDISQTFKNISDKGNEFVFNNLDKILDGYAVIQKIESSPLDPEAKTTEIFYGLRLETETEFLSRKEEEQVYCDRVLKVARLLSDGVTDSKDFVLFSPGYGYIVDAAINYMTTGEHPLYKQQSDARVYKVVRDLLSQEVTIGCSSYIWPDNVSKEEMERAKKMVNLTFSTGERLKKEIVV